MTPLQRVLGLPIWQGAVTAEPLGGGITNVNFRVRHGGGQAVVRIGDDIPVHQILRFNEVSASRAAYLAGVSPAVLHHEPGVLVIDFIEGRTLGAVDFQAEGVLEQALSLVARAHRDMPRFLRGACLTFWVFHVIRDYAATLAEGGSPYRALLPDLLAQAAVLEQGGWGGSRWSLATTTCFRPISCWTRSGCGWWTGTMRVGGRPCLTLAGLRPTTG